MKKLLLFFPLLLSAFKVEFTEIYTKYVIPDKNAILIETKKKDLSFPFKFIKTEKGYILVGDSKQINMWLNNDFYAPDDAKFKNIKITIIHKDKLQYNIIQKLKSTYKNCLIKKIIFLSPNEEKIITKPTTIKEKYKILLDCK